MVNLSKPGKPLDIATFKSKPKFLRLTLVNRVNPLVVLDF